MSDGWKMVKLEEFSIEENLYKEMMILAKRQNANPSNNIARLIAIGIGETYRKYPNLKLKEVDNEQR